MGQLTFLVLRPIRNDLNDLQKTSICSREELQREFMDVNMRVDDLLRELKPERPQRACKSASIQDSSMIVVGSMDVNSLYPSCLLKEAYGHIRDALKRGHTKFHKVDMQFLLKYIAATEGKTGTTLDKFLPTPKGTTTLHSMTFNETCHQFWGAEEPACQMAEEHRTLAIGWGISKVLEVTYKHHHYTVGGKVYQQADGGPQGLKTDAEASEFGDKFLGKL